MQNHYSCARCFRTRGPYRFTRYHLRNEYPHCRPSQLCPTRWPNTRMVYRCTRATCQSSPPSLESQCAVQRSARSRNWLCPNFQWRPIPRSVPFFNPSSNDPPRKTHFHQKGRLDRSIRTSLHVNCGQRRGSHRLVNSCRIPSYPYSVHRRQSYSLLRL